LSAESASDHNSQLAFTSQLHQLSSKHPNSNTDENVRKLCHPCDLSADCLVDLQSPSRVTHSRMAVSTSQFHHKLLLLPSTNKSNSSCSSSSSSRQSSCHSSCHSSRHLRFTAGEKLRRTVTSGGWTRLLLMSATDSTRPDRLLSMKQTTSSRPRGRKQDMHPDRLLPMKQKTSSRPRGRKQDRRSDGQLVSVQKKIWSLMTCRQAHVHCIWLKRSLFLPVSMCCSGSCFPHFLWLDLSKKARNTRVIMCIVETRHAALSIWLSGAPFQRVGLD